jgi:hypothetical protein
MGIQNFPAALQPIIQQGFLEREFQQALKSRLGYRACADRVKIAVGIGETLTRARAGLKPSISLDGWIRRRLRLPRHWRRARTPILIMV